MRIAYVITGLHLGGAETQLGRLAQAMHKTNDVLVISLTDGGEIAQQLTKAGVRVQQLRCTNPINAVTRLRSALKAFKPNVVHSFLWHANVATRFATDAVIISSYRGKEPAAWREWVDRFTRSRSDYFTTNSNYLATYFSLPKNKTKVIANGVPESFWKGHKYKPKKQQAIMVGQLRWEKDYRTLIDTAKALPSWKFLIVGKGPREAELKAYARNVKNVVFLGQRHDIAELLCTSTCLVHLSFTEGSPNTVIEAMLLGVPVVASDIPALQELVKGRGVLVPEKNPAKVVAALQKQTGKEATAVKQWARKTFSQEQMITEYKRFYKHLS